MAVALAALDATVVVQEPGGERRIPVTELHRLPGDEPERDTVLAPGALVTAVEVPPLAFGATSAYRKVRDRALLRLRRWCRWPPRSRWRTGACATCGWPSAPSPPGPGGHGGPRTALRGGPATEDAFRAAADLELDAAEPLPDNGFKVPLVGNVVARVLADLAARGESPAGRRAVEPGRCSRDRPCGTAPSPTPPSSTTAGASTAPTR